VSKVIPVLAGQPQDELFEKAKKIPSMIVARRFPLRKRSSVSRR
jgi:hypothetical protein